MVCGGMLYDVWRMNYDDARFSRQSNNWHPKKSTPIKILTLISWIQSNKNITMAAAKPVVKISAMPAQMQADATIFAADGLNLFYEENDVAGYVKEQFEKKVRVQQ